MVKSVLKWAVIGLLGLVAVLVLGGLLLSRTFTVVRSTVVAAPPDAVYAALADPRRWNDWAVWNKRDPAMKITYSGPATGAGAVWAWQSKTEGDGRMTFTQAVPGQRLAYDLYFPDWDSTSRGDFVLRPDGPGTRVTWTMVGDMGANPVWRWMGLMADRMVGPDFEQGLAGLKAVAEKR